MVFSLSLRQILPGTHLDGFYLFCISRGQGPELLTIAWCRKDWKRISAASSVMSPRWPNRSRDWTELSWISPTRMRCDRYRKRFGSVVASLAVVPTGSPSRGGDVVVYIFDINQPSLPTPFHSVLVSVSVCMALQTVFHSMNSPRQLFAFSLFFRSYIGLVGPFNYIFLHKVSFNPDVVLCGWLGLKHQLTNSLAVCVRSVQRYYLPNVYWFDIYKNISGQHRGTTIIFEDSGIASLGTLLWWFRTTWIPSGNSVWNSARFTDPSTDYTDGSPAR